MINPFHFDTQALRREAAKDTAAAFAQAEKAAKNPADRELVACQKRFNESPLQEIDIVLLELFNEGCDTDRVYEAAGFALGVVVASLARNAGMNGNFSGLAMLHKSFADAMQGALSQGGTGNDGTQVWTTQTVHATPGGRA